MTTVTVRVTQRGFLLTLYSLRVFGPGSEICEHRYQGRLLIPLKTLKTYAHILAKCCHTVQLTSHGEWTEARAGVW